MRTTTRVLQGLLISPHFRRPLRHYCGYVCVRTGESVPATTISCKTERVLSTIGDYINWGGCGIGGDLCSATV